MDIRNKRSSEGGYALLAIFLGAVLLSVLLVKALPREAMSAQRIREQRLIDRGEQYARAIKLYFREHKKYPEELDDLEDTNGVRYLRRRYKDPITNQDEWRLIHVGPDGRFKDSLVYDTESPEEMMNADDEMGRGQGGSRSGRGGNTRRNQPSGPMDTNTYQALYGTPPPPQPGVFAGADLARQTRQSAAPDNPLQRNPAQFSMEQPTPAGDPNNPETAGLGPDGRPLPIQQQQPTDYSNLPPGQVPPEAGQRQPQQQNQPGYPVQSAGGPGYALPTSRGAIGNRGMLNQPPTPQSAGGQPAGFGMANVSPDAASVIGRLLTTPRPGGLAGIQQGNAAMQQGMQQGQAFQEGIAGVASKAEQFGVKVYKGKNTYKEWEFVYDYRQDMAMGGMPGMQGAQGNMGNLDPNQPGLTGGGGLTGVPGAFPQIPGMAPPGGPLPGQSQIGDAGASRESPQPEANEQADPEPIQGDSGGAPGEPTQVSPEATDLDTPNLTPGPAAPPSRTYQLPKSRFGAPNQ